VGSNAPIVIELRHQEALALVRDGYGRRESGLAAREGVYIIDTRSVANIAGTVDGGEFVEWCRAVRRE